MTMKTPTIQSILVFYGFLSCLPTSHAFPVLYRRLFASPGSSVVVRSLSPSHLASTSNPIDDDERTGSTSTTTSTDEMKAQTQDLLTTLSELESLQSSVMQAQDKETLESLQVSLNDAGRQVSTQMSMLVPPAGMSAAEYASTMRIYAKLPLRSRIAFCKALDMPVDAALDFAQIPTLAAMLYTKRQQLTPDKLQAAMKSTESLVFTKRGATNTSLSNVQTKTMTSEPKGLASLFQPGRASSSEEALSPEDEQFNTLLEQAFGRVTRQQGREATQTDLEKLQAVLKDRKIFAVSDTQKIPGGFLLFGTPNNQLEPDTLLQAIDKKLPRQWPCQVSYINDFTATSRGDEASLNAPTLVLLRKDMAPEARPLLRTLSNLAAISTAFLFSVGVYGGNQLVMDRLEEKTPAGDFVGLEWFTEKTFEVLLPILAIQLVHELGHLIVQKRYDLKTTLPTLLPGWGLPLLGCQTNLVESPPSQKALFDFSFAGPLLGLLAATGFFVTGLELTNAAGPETIKYLPALPVDVLRSSTLGGSLVDYFFGRRARFHYPTGSQNGDSLASLCNCRLYRPLGQCLGTPSTRINGWRSHVHDNFWSTGSVARWLWCVAVFAYCELYL